jgi:hypothetical protein
MPSKRVSIAQVMMIVALAAGNLAIARATPWEIVSVPTIWVALGILAAGLFLGGLLGVSKLKSRRPVTDGHVG